MMATGTLERFATTRLTAERPAQAHLDDLIRLHLDPAVSRYLGGVRSPEATISWLDAQLAHWVECGFGVWVLHGMDGAFVGRAGLRRVELDGTREIEIVYSLARAYWGRGLATEIAAALIDLWLTRINSPSLAGIVAVGNTASRRVLEKSGFGFERRTVFRSADVVVLRRMRAE